MKRVEVVKRMEIGKGFAIEMVEISEITHMNMPHYDIVLYSDGEFVKNMSSNCYGEKSGKYWLDYHVKQMKRYVFLLDEYDNTSCCETDKKAMLEQWIFELSVILTK